MAIAASGAVSFSDLRTEFVGGSSAISYSDLYRGGSNIRSKAGNNTGVNLAASVPTSGTINISNFRSQAKGFKFTFTSGATNQSAATLFGDDYAVNYPKEIVINNGVELGATSSTEEALEIPSGGSGTITVTNNGTLSGAGGSAGGGAGGDAFETAVACVLINNGTIRAGGGGGGAGGTGGGGSYTTTGNQSRSRSSSNYYQYDTANSITWIKWDNVLVKNGGFGDWQSYAQGKLWYPYGQYIGSTVRTYGVTTSVTTTHYTNGGSGGSGGKGQGYVSGNASGSSGSAGGTNAGTGGTGGTGGTYGNAGGTGSTGANGNNSNGSGGSSGGAAGNYIRGISLVTLTQSGTVQGGTA